jgi:hypothetical protein
MSTTKKMTPKSQIEGGSTEEGKKDAEEPAAKPITKTKETPKKRKSEDKKESQKKKKKLNHEDEEKVEYGKSFDETDEEEEDKDEDELENSSNKVNSELENFEKKLSKAELPGVNEEAKDKQNVFWNDSSLLSDILKDNYEKEGKSEYFEEDWRLLQKQRVTNLRDWKKLTKEEKMKYPDGLKHLLDDVCGIENKVENKDGKIFLNFILFIRKNESQLEQSY